jgi:hypothetical protein
MKDPVLFEGCLPVLLAGILSWVLIFWVLYDLGVFG